MARFALPPLLSKVRTPRTPSDAAKSPVPAGDLAAALSEHDKWLDSNAREGDRLNLENRSLRGVKFPANADLREVNLRDADLRYADLTGANLQKADLTDAKLWDATLRNADLRETEGLLEAQLSGADLCRAKLPDGFEFEGLANVEELSKNAGKLFLSLILACIFILLTIAKINDVQLITDTGAATLPVLSVEVPVRLFFGLAPAVLLVLFVSFHLYLQRLWEALADLPAVFPNGVTLDRKTYSWLLNDLVCAYFPKIKKIRWPLVWPQVILFGSLAYWLIPLSLLPIWARYLCRHEWTVTTIHIWLLAAGLWGAVLFFLLALITMKRGEVANRWLKSLLVQVSVLVGFMLLIIATVNPFRIWSENALGGTPNDGVPEQLASVGLSPFADLEEQDVSAKPANWKGSSDNVELVNGARLKGSHLEHMNARGAFLVKSDLRGAHLEWAVLSESDMRAADLSNAHVDNAFLRKTKLDGSKLTGIYTLYTDFTEVKLNDADLVEARFPHGMLIKAELRRANFKWAYLATADLTDADVRGAALKDAKNCDRASWKNARYDKYTTWPNDFDPQRHGAILVDSITGKPVKQPKPGARAAGTGAHGSSSRPSR